ncbi:thioredoxin family protein [Pseudoclavibacter helvolus]|mgnify:FL=1|uniref:thioredoxin family protein n=1 Tax=Pseudoclavibacter helvolus TaxID=255205 RepID=UPI0024ACA4E1|nr:thioredoxin family protein [Pseudoclavibacter helvolus]
MDASVAALVLGALVVVATVIGLVLQRANGRLKRASDPAAGTSEAPTANASDLDLLAEDAEPGSRATLILFSTEFCAKCPATKRMLDQLAAQTPGVVVAEVDLTHRQDLARSHDIRQTPTVLVLGESGTRVARIGGPPRRSDLEDQLLQLST